MDFVLRTDRLRARVHATTKDGADIEVQYADLCAVVSEMLGDPVAVARMRFVPRDDDVIGSGVDAHNFRGMCEALREAGRLVNAAEAAASRGTRLETLCVGLKFFMDAFELTRTRGSQHNAHVGVYFGLVRFARGALRLRRMPDGRACALSQVNEPVRITGGAGRAVRTGLVAPKKAVPFELLQLFVPALIVLWHEGVVVEVAGVGLRRVFGAVVAGVTDHEERTVLACTKAAMGHFPVYHSTMPAAEIAARLARLGPLATAPEPPPRTVAMYRDFLAHVRTLTAADAAAASVLRGFVAPHTCARYGNGGVSPLVSLPYFNTCYLPYGMAVCYMHALPENLFRRLIESICRAAQRAGALDRINACTRRLGGYPTVKDVSRYGLVRLVRKRGGAPVVTASDTGAEMVDSALKACVFVLVGEACGDLETYTLLRHALRVMAWLQLGWYDAARLRELQRELDEFLRRWVLHFTARDWDGVGEPPPRDADAASVDFAYLVHVAAYPDYIAATGPPKDTDTRGAEHHHGVNRDAVLRSNRRSVSGTPLAAAESRAWRGRLLTLLPANVSTALTARPRRVSRFADGQAFGPSRIGVAVPLARAAVLAAAAPASAAPWPAHGGGATLREHQCRGVYLRGRRLALPSTAGAAATHAAARRPLCLVVELLVMSRDAAAAWRASLPGNAPVIGPDRMTGGAAKLEFTLLVERVVEVVVAAGATASDAAASGQRHTVLEGVLLRELPLADVRRTAPTCANAVESGCVAAVEKTALRLSVFVGPTAPGARIRAPWLERCDTAPHVLLSALHVDDVLLVQPHASVSHAATGAAPAGGDALAHAWSTAVRDLYEDNDYNSDDDTGEAW